MHWASWSAFWDMGGAALFVWGSYAVTAVLVIVELVMVLKRRKETVRRLLRLRRVTAGQGSGRRSRDRA
jgi:heme exporter protein D